MQIKVDEITDILRRQIEGLDTGVEMAEVGTVVSIPEADFQACRPVGGPRRICCRRG